VTEAIFPSWTALTKSLKITFSYSFFDLGYRLKIKKPRIINKRIIKTLLLLGPGFEVFGDIGSNLP
jgi:hypothetical protein